MVRQFKSYKSQHVCSIVKISYTYWVFLYSVSNRSIYKRGVGGIVKNNVEKNFISRVTFVSL